MVRIDKNGSFMRLYDAMTTSECGTCGKDLEWNPGFGLLLGHPKYISHHCGHEYVITVDTVRVMMVNVTDRNSSNQNNYDLDEIGSKKRSKITLDV